MGVTENLLAQIDKLNKELKEKDAIIDWLAEKACQCAEASKQGGYCSYADECFICIQNRNMPTPNDWRKAAQESVKKNDKS